MASWNKGDVQHAVRLGNAFSALKQTSPTDWPWPTRAETEGLLREGETRLVR